MRWGRVLVVGAMLVGAVATGAPPVAEAASVPAGFTDVAVGSASAPTAVEWMPGDRIVVLEKAGRVRVGRPGSTTFTTALQLNVCTASEQGLLGFTHDPGYWSNQAVYLYYTAPTASGCVNRVSRFRMGGDTIDLASEVVLLDNISARGGNHNGGDLEIGSDGYLYVAVGDAGRDPRGDSGSAGANDAAQDLSLLNGKILRITTDGFPAPGNPFTG
ncbi:MAG: PQQ-dependent sugar dehydrogenase, partial [Ilumatobacter sp.]|nr:PQQ-dependent sugar dehydrogenase [Ilumatobacter sp.]